MPNPNKTVAAARGRKWFMVDQFTSLATRGEAEAARDKLKALHAGARVRIVPYRVGPRGSSLQRFNVRAYLLQS